MHRLIYLQLILWNAVGYILSARAQDVVFIDPSRSGTPGSPCTTKGGGRGQCTEVLNCPEIRATLGTNPPSTCGFRGSTPIICCPDAEATTGNPVPPPAPVLDIAAPRSRVRSICGRSSVKIIFDRDEPGFARFKRAKKFDFKNPGTPGSYLKPAVVGGIESQRNAWPWMALIGIKEGAGYSWFCGGVLINDQWVLTAAHCIDSRTPTTVRLGEHNYEISSDDSNEEDFEISRMVPHPDYAFPVAYHDLALLQLKTQVILKEFISPLCLPWADESQKNLTGRLVKVTGWGDTQFAGSPSPALQEVDITMFSNSRCQRAYSALRQFRQHWPNGIGEETVCAGNEQGGRDACQGDSGGPLIYLGDEGRYYLSGIVSTGYGCGHKDFPGIYANILHPPHMAWIKKVAFSRRQRITVAF